MEKIHVSLFGQSSSGNLVMIEFPLLLISATTTSGLQPCVSLSCYGRNECISVRNYLQNALIAVHSVCIQCLAKFEIRPLGNLHGWPVDLHQSGSVTVCTFSELFIHQDMKDIDFRNNNETYLPEIFVSFNLIFTHVVPLRKNKFPGHQMEPVLVLCPTVEPG